MKVLLCDKCKEILEIGNNKVIVASAVWHKLMYEAHIEMESISLSVLTGEHFCSIKCLKESIK